MIRCPVCADPVRRRDLYLHLQDPVDMIEHAEAYRRILRPFYRSLRLSKFTVGEINGSSKVIKAYRKQSEEVRRGPTAFADVRALHFRCACEGAHA